MGELWTSKVEDEKVAGENRQRMLAGAEQKKTDTPAAAEDDGLAMTVDQESHVYGYALIGALFNIVAALCISSMPLTDWGGSVPSVNTWLWALIFMSAPIWWFALKCTFAIATGSPHVLPGGEIDCWEYAPVCFASMFSCGTLFYLLFYIVPLLIGANPEFYYLDTVPTFLIFTVGVVLTRRLMWAYHDRIRGRGNGALVSGPRNGAGAQRKEARLLEDLLESGNMIIIGFIIVGCELSRMHRECLAQ